MTLFKSNKISPSERKLRGGYYTPLALAEFLSKWAIRTGFESVLEPSCGDGNFIAAVQPRLKRYAHVTAVELQAEELEKAKDRCSDASFEIDWLQGDFFSVYEELQRQDPFDVVLGNPPFIRFQHFDGRSRDCAFEHLRTAGYRPTKLANAWCGFVQLCAELVVEDGRMALVLPAELLQVGYAQQLRDRLPALFDQLVLIAFDELVFPDIQQEVVLLLAAGRSDRGRKAGTFHTLRLRNGEQLISPGLFEDQVEHAPSRHAQPGMKWTALFLDGNDFEILESTYRRADVAKLGEYARVDVGVVTGRNSFFVMQARTADEIGINGFAVPVVGRTSALKSIRFNDGDMAAYRADNPSRLLNLSGIGADRFSDPLKDYLAAGAREGVDRGYKCSVRPRWYDVPSIYVPDAFLFRQIHTAPFMVANHARATATDTIHRVRVKPGVEVDRLCAASINSLSFAWAEVCGRSYGGGVLELEPSEAEELPCLYEHAGELDLDYIDSKLRAGQLDAAIAHGDQVLLVQGLGLSDAEVRSLNQAWKSLRDKRQGRRRGSSVRAQAEAQPGLTEE